MMNRKKLLAGAVGASFCGLASAASVDSLMFDFTKLEDQSAEYLWIDSESNGLLEVGDVLRGILSYETLINVNDNSETNDLGGTSGNDELAGVFAVEVESRTLAFTDGGGNDFYQYVFTSYDDFADEVAVWTGETISDGTVLALFTDSTSEFAIGGSTCTTAGPTGDCEGNITNGDIWATVGFEDLDDYWVTTGIGAPEDTALFQSATEGEQLGSFQFGLSILDNFSAVEFVEEGLPALTDVDDTTGNALVDVQGVGSLYGRNATDGSGAITPYDLIDDTDAWVKTVPEPSSVALLGLGLLGLAGGAYRKRKA